MSTMTIPSEVITHLESATTALTRQLSAGSGWTIEAEVAPTEIDGSRVVVAMLADDVRIALMMMSPFARGLIVGPPPADSLEEALELGFAAAARVLESVLGRTLTLGTLTESTPDEAVRSMGGATISFRLLDGDNHVASFVKSRLWCSIRFPKVRPRSPIIRCRCWPTSRWVSPSNSAARNCRLQRS